MPSYSIENFSRGMLRSRRGTNVLGGDAVSGFADGYSLIPGHDPTTLRLADGFFFSEFSTLVSGTDASLISVFTTGPRSVDIINSNYSRSRYGLEPLTGTVDRATSSTSGDFGYDIAQNSSNTVGHVVEADGVVFGSDGSVTTVMLNSLGEIYAVDEDVTFSNYFSGTIEEVRGKAVATIGIDEGVSTLDDRHPVFFAADGVLYIGADNNIFKLEKFATTDVITDANTIGAVLGDYDTSIPNITISDVDFVYYTYARDQLVAVEDGVGYVYSTATRRFLRIIEDAPSRTEIGTSTYIVTRELRVAEEDIIAAITLTGDHMSIYTNPRRSNPDHSSRRYIWNRVSQVYEYRSTIPNGIVYGAVTIGGIEYFISGDDPVISTASGYETTPVARVHGSLNVVGSIIPRRSIKVRNDKLVFWCNYGIAKETESRHVNIETDNMCSLFEFGKEGDEPAGLFKIYDFRNAYPIDMAVVSETEVGATTIQSDGSARVSETLLDGIVFLMRITGVGYRGTGGGLPPNFFNIQNLIGHSLNHGNGRIFTKSGSITTTNIEAGPNMNIIPKKISITADIPKFSKISVELFGDTVEFDGNDSGISTYEYVFPDSVSDNNKLSPILRPKITLEHEDIEVDVINRTFVEDAIENEKNVTPVIYRFTLDYDEVKRESRSTGYVYKVPQLFLSSKFDFNSRTFGPQSSGKLFSTNKEFNGFNELGELRSTLYRDEDYGAVNIPGTIDFHDGKLWLIHGSNINTAVQVGPRTSTFPGEYLYQVNLNDGFSIDGILRLSTGGVFSGRDIEKLSFPPLIVSHGGFLYVLGEDEEGGNSSTPGRRRTILTRISTEPIGENPITVYTPTEVPNAANLIDMTSHNGKIWAIGSDGHSLYTFNDDLTDIAEQTSLVNRSDGLEATNMIGLASDGRNLYVSFIDNEQNRHVAKIDVGIGNQYIATTVFTDPEAGYLAFKKD